MVNGRQKGHSYERKIAVDFQEMGFDAITKRAARGGDWSTSDDGIDLVGTEPFAVQVKRYRDYVPINTIEEINCWPKDNSPVHGFGVQVTGPDYPMIPLLITKKDHGEAMCVLPWSEMKKIIKAYYAPTQQA